jgi:hypothetical protein
VGHHAPRRYAPGRTKERGPVAREHPAQHVAARRSTSQRRRASFSNTRRRGSDLRPFVVVHIRGGGRGCACSTCRLLPPIHVTYIAGARYQTSLSPGWSVRASHGRNATITTSSASNARSRVLNVN